MIRYDTIRYEIKILKMLIRNFWSSKCPKSSNSIKTLQIQNNFHLLSYMTKKKANPYVKEAETRKCVTFLLEK